MPPDVSECKGAEKGVTQGVDGYIAIRMGYAAFDAVNLHTTQPKGKSFGKGMYVVSVSYSYIHFVVV